MAFGGSLVKKLFCENHLCRDTVMVLLIMDLFKFMGKFHIGVIKMPNV